jgi:hypothetical protein
MTKTLVMRMLVMLAATTGSAVAEEAAPAPAPPPKTKTIGVDGGIALPTGDWGEGAGFGIGALARFEMPLIPALVLTARAGFIKHLSKESEGGMLGGDTSSSATQIPVFGGVRYAFSQKPTSAIYGAAELGFVNYRVTVDIGEMSMTDSDTNLGLTLGAGYRMGKLDLRAGLEFPDAGEGDFALMATVGYDITAF